MGRFEVFPNKELPITEEGGGPAGVNEPDDDGGGPAGVVEGLFESRKPYFLPGVDGAGLDEYSGAVNPAMLTSQWRTLIARFDVI